MVITGAILIPKLLIPYDTYMIEGDYEKAYNKAGDEEKELVIKENIAVVVSALTKEKLKDSSSFVLREVYVEKGMKNVVVKEQGNNSIGAAVTGYVWFQWDDRDEQIDKMAGNLVKGHVKEAISNKKFKMSTAVTDRINGLNKKGKLGDIELLDEAKAILGKKENKEEAKS